MSPQVSELKELSLATQGWQGGINIRDSLAQLAPNDLRRSENVTFDSAGGLSKRAGTTSYGPVGAGTERVISCYTFYRGSATPQVLVHTSAGIMYYTTNATSNPITWTVIVSGLSTTQAASFETENSKCYFAEGTVLGQWDGAVYTVISSAPAGICFLRVWKDTMWAAGLLNPDRVYSSSAGDPTTWPAANFVDILHGDGDSITALASDGLYMIVSKHRRIQVITDPAQFVNRTADWEKGSESHFGWVHLEDKLYFLSRLGICWWQGDSAAKLISYKIDPLFDPNVLNLNMLQKSWAYTIGSKAGWAVPEAGNGLPTLIMEYYPRLGPIYQISGSIGPGPWTFHRMPVSTFTTVRQGSTEALYGGSPSTNKFMKCFDGVGQDDGVSFFSTVEGAPMLIDSPIFEKYFRRMHVVGNGKMNLQLKRDYGTGVYQTIPIDFTSSSEIWGSGNWDTGVWGPDSVIKEEIFDLDAYAKIISICVSDVDINIGANTLPVGSRNVPVTQGAWSLYSVTFDAILLGMRG
jgi:hypothetical protein